MQYTKNYNFKKPDYTDNADIMDINNMVDAVDGQMKSLSDVSDAHMKILNDVNTCLYNFAPYTNKAIFTSSGNWTCPTGIKKVAIWMQDGGGGSGG